MIRSAFTNRFLATTFLIFFLFLIATVIAWKITSDVLAQEGKSRFYQNASDIKSRVQERVDLYILAIDGLHGFLEASDEVTRDEWSTYIQRVRLLEKYPGVSSISYIKKLDNKDKNAFIESVRKDTLTPTFTIYPKAEKDTYYVVKYIEPIKGREKVLGFDMGSEEKRLQAIERARDSGEAASTRKITLATTNAPGFGILVPVYKNNVDITSHAARKAGIRGFVYAIFRGDDMFRAVYGKEDPFPNEDFEIYDGETISKENLLYDHDPAHIISKSHFMTTESVAIDGQKWVILICNKNRPALTKSQQLLPTAVLLSGLGFSFIFLSIFLYKFRQHIKTYKQSTNP